MTFPPAAASIAFVVLLVDLLRPLLLTYLIAQLNLFAIWISIRQT